MKLWKKILIIIAILLIIFIIIVSRKVLILNSLNDKISKYENSTNAYSKVTTNLEDSKLEQMESFLKDDVIKTIAKFKNADNLDSTVIQFEYPDVMKTYIEDGDRKTFSSYKNEVIERNIIINYASYNNIFELIYNSIVSRIYTDTLDEKECYVIESTANSNFLYGEDVINVKVYIDGVEKLSGSLYMSSMDFGVEHSDESNGKPRCFWIGYSYNNDRYLDGYVSETRIWNRELTVEEINSANHFYKVEPDAEGLVAYWKFNEGAGKTIKDQTSYGNDLTVDSEPEWKAVTLPE